MRQAFDGAGAIATKEPENVCAMISVTSPPERPGVGALADLGRELLAARGSEFLRVAEPRDWSRRVEYDGAGDHRARQRAATDFIDARDMGTLEHEVALAEEIANRQLSPQSDRA